MLHTAMPAQLQHVDEADQIAFNIGVRIFQRVAHACLCGQVDHLGRLDFIEQRGQAVAVGDVQRADIQLRAQRRHTIALELRVVVIVVVVQPDNALAACGQGLAGIGADEAGGTGYENGHQNNPRLCLAALPRPDMQISLLSAQTSGSAALPLPGFNSSACRYTDRIEAVHGP